LKIPRQNFAWDKREVEFYHTLVPLMFDTYAPDELPFVRCYDASYSATIQHSHLLLEDLSLTHFTTDGLMPPSRRYCEQVIEAFALFHAYWWEHPRLGQGIGELLTEALIDTFISDAQTKWAEFVKFRGERLARDQYEILQAVVSAWPAERRKRVVRGEGITLVHRDPHPLNFLYPRDPTQGGVKLIDWQSWRVDTGTDDLAYGMACHWPWEQRRLLEGDLLKQYHQRLVERGVQQYDWADCLYDYRASIIRCLFFLMVAWSSAQWETGVWWHRVQKGIAAFKEWNCAELLPT
jgi:hypothetical protein